MIRHDPLAALESESIYVLRETYRLFSRPALLWSIGKDSTVLLWLVRKAFAGHVPFPLVHIDTSYKIASMIEYRDRLVREWRLDLVAGRHEAALAAGLTYPNGRATRVECCSTLKKDALHHVIADHGYTAIVAGIRRDEDPTRAKERYFSIRDRHMRWDVGHQPPELWSVASITVPAGSHMRVHPLLHWTELNVWEYIEREAIPVIPLYFDDGTGHRYRSLGCAPCTGRIASTAATVPAIVAELRALRTAERAGRAQDHESDDAFERLRRDGYM